MRFVAWLAAALSLFVGHRASGASAAEPSRVRVLAETIPGSVPAEFAADLLMRLADSAHGAREGKDFRVTLYRQAFDLAADAQDAAPVHRPPEPVDYRTTLFERASNMLGLDGLSLRVRAIRNLLELQPSLAAALVERFDVRLPVLTCADHLVPNPSAMFDVARALPYESFETLIVGVRSSSAVAPAIYAVLEARLQPEQIQHLLVSLADSVRSIRDDDRTLTASSELVWTAVSRAIDRADDPAVRTLMIDAFREYLVRHLTGDRCAVPGTLNSREDFERFLEKESKVIVEINRLLVAHDRAPLSRSEMTPARVTASTVVGTRRSPAALAAMAEIDGLRRESQGQPPTVVPDALEDPAAPDFRDRIGRIRDTMGRWTAHDEQSDEDYFNLRRTALGGLIGVLKPGTDRDQALAELLAMTKAEGIDRYSHVEWFFPIRSLIQSYKGSTRDRDWMLRALRDSGDPIMRAYARVEELTGR